MSGTGEEVIIGSVPYLNARPLVRWFSDTEAGRASGVRVVEAVPSELARRLARGEVAAALVSSIELFRQPGFRFAPNIAIAADGPVHSVRLLSRAPIESIQSVALDTSSLTSVALLQILLAERYGLSPRYLPAAPDLEPMLAEADAALLIGDLGYREYDRRLYTLDLGEGWRDLTGLPFTYALWVGPEGGLTRPLAATLLRAKEWGTAHREKIARLEYGRRGETYARTYHYLSEIMCYDLGPREQAALGLFGRKAYAQGLLEAPPPSAEHYAAGETT